MYNILIDKEEVGTGLSQGELNQWLIDFDNELKGNDKKEFRKGLGFKSGNFENYLYSDCFADSQSTKKTKYKNKILEITEYLF